MAFHRVTPFLRPAIRSILEQGFGDLELILVDDGAGVGAGEVPELADPRVRVVVHPTNRGIAAAHNTGVAQARAEFIALLDYDDLALPDRLARQVAALRADEGLGLVSALALRMDAAGRTGGPVFCLPDPAAHRPYSQYAAPVITPALMGRREIFAQLPYRAEFPFAADLDFQARAAEITRLAVIPQVLIHYRWYAAQTTQSRLGEIEKSRCLINLCTARRRAGLAEQLKPTLEAMAPASLATTLAQVGELAVVEGHVELAAYCARRLLAAGRRPRTVGRALQLAGRAWHHAAPERRSFVRRLFMTGPVRALALEPA